MFVIVNSLNSLNLGEPYKVNVKNILSSLDFNSEGAYSSEMTSPQKIFSAYLYLLILIGQLVLEKNQLRLSVVRFTSVLFKILKKCFLLHNFSVRCIFIDSSNNLLIIKSPELLVLREKELILVAHNYLPHCLLKSRASLSECASKAF